VTVATITLLDIPPTTDGVRIVDDSEDCQAGIRAFKEKRAPRFNGK
jgi:hypothetical protein